MYNIQSVPSHEILLIEDSQSDIELLTEAFRAVNFSNSIHTVEDGSAALSFLRAQSQTRPVASPAVILLDINLPKKNGLEVLAEIKTDPALKRIPVIVLTTSASAEDIFQAYDLHANCYISKPSSLDEFIHIAQLIVDFWLGVVKLPTTAI